MNYRYTFDPTTGVYTGIVRTMPFPENSTIIEPHFAPEKRTVWTFQGFWKLVDRDAFIMQVQEQDVLKKIDMDMIKRIESVEASFQSVIKDVCNVVEKAAWKSINDNREVQKLAEELYQKNNFLLQYMNEKISRALVDIEVIRNHVEEKSFFEKVKIILFGFLKKRR